MSAAALPIDARPLEVRFVEAMDRKLVEFAERQVDEFFRLSNDPAISKGELIPIGKVLLKGFSHPDFPNRSLGEKVAARLWYLDIHERAKSMTDEEADSVLKEAGLL